MKLIIFAALINGGRFVWSEQLICRPSCFITMKNQIFIEVYNNSSTYYCLDKKKNLRAYITYFMAAILFFSPIFIYM